MNNFKGRNKEGGKSNKYSGQRSRYQTKPADKKSDTKRGESKPFAKKQGSAGKSVKKKYALPNFDDKVRLNKFIANAGICSRREADTLISTGVVSVNGKVITEMGFKVSSNDIVKYDGITIKHDPKHYVLLNKPNDFTLKFSDDVAKKSAYQLIKNASKEMLFPVGKMDKTDCGLVLFTNDSDLEQRLTHPSIQISQIFHVVLDKDMEEEDLKKLEKGVFVDNRMFAAKEANFIPGKPRSEIGIKVLSHKSNMVKLMMGKLEYKIEKLDRVEYGGLTKKDLPRGNYRHLTKQEIGFLQMNKWG